MSTIEDLELLPELEEEWESYPLPTTGESDLVRTAIRQGTTNENTLANMVFFARHPERNGRAISRNEHNFRSLSKEWLNIRDTIIRPLLRGETTYPTVPQLPPSEPVYGPLAARIMDEARRWLGFREGPNNENPFSAYFGVPNVAWCAYFVSYVYTKGGMRLRFGSTDAMLNHLRTRGQFFPNTTAPQPADIVVFDWTQGDHDASEHVGLVEKVYRDNAGRTRVGTIEGNSSNGVNRRNYALGDVRIVGFGRLVPSTASAREIGELESATDLHAEWELKGEATFDFSQEVPTAVRRLLPPSGQQDTQRERQAIAEAIKLGDRNENHLSDIIFFNRHPERGGRFIERAERDYTTVSREWIAIRNTIVRPALRGTTPPAPGRGPVAPLTITSIRITDDRFAGALSWDQIIGLDTTTLNIELIAATTSGAPMPLHCPVEVTSRVPNGVSGSATLAKPVRLDVPRIGGAAGAGNRSIYRISSPLSQLGPFLMAERSLKEVATVVRRGGTSDARFRRALGWTSRGIAVQPVSAGASTGSELSEIPDARALFRAAGAEVLQVKVPHQPNWQVPAPVKRLVRSPADVFYYSGHGLSRNGKLVIDIQNKQCPERGTYRDWLGASDLIPFWTSPMDLDVLILAGCSVLKIVFSGSRVSGPGLGWARLVTNKGGPLAAVLGYQAGAPCDQPGGNKIAEQMARRIARGSTDFVRDWLVVNGENNANNAVAINSRGYWWIEGTLFGGYEIKGPRRIR